MTGKDRTHVFDAYGPLDDGDREITERSDDGNDATDDQPVDEIVLNSVEIEFCADELRNNEQARIKGTYFLSTSGGGTHDFGFGVETFTETRASGLIALIQSTCFLWSSTE